MKTVQPKDGDHIDFNKKVETPDFSSPKKWVPNDGNTQTMIYGRGTPTPSPTIEEMAEMDVATYYPFMLKHSEDWNRRYKEFLANYK